MSALKPKIALFVAMAAVAGGALIPTAFAGPSKSSSATVRVERSKLGRILVDGRGRTLYLFEKDRHGKSTCYGVCATDWPPLIASGMPHAAAGVKASLLGTTKRKDGRRQVTYKGHPLYRFFKDTRKGQTNGEGLDVFGAEWFAVSPAGAAKVEPSSAGGDAPPGY